MSVNMVTDTDKPRTLLIEKPVVNSRLTGVKHPRPPSIKFMTCQVPHLPRLCAHRRPEDCCFRGGDLNATC